MLETDFSILNYDEPILTCNHQRQRRLLLSIRETRAARASARFCTCRSLHRCFARRRADVWRLLFFAWLPARKKRRCVVGPNLGRRAGACKLQRRRRRRHKQLQTCCICHPNESKSERASDSCSWVGIRWRRSIVFLDGDKTTVCKNSRCLMGAICISPIAQQH